MSPLNLPQKAGVFRLFDNRISFQYYESLTQSQSFVHRTSVFYFWKLVVCHVRTPASLSDVIPVLQAISTDLL